MRELVGFGMNSPDFLNAGDRGRQKPRGKLIDRRLASAVADGGLHLMRLFFGECDGK